jgi:hypothetical protein
VKRLCLLLLTGCASPVPLPPPDTPLIEVSFGGPVYGSQSTVIYADGTVVTATDGPLEKPKSTVRQGSPDVYRAAAAVLAERGPAAQSAQVPQSGCEDYGTDMVVAEPSIAGFDAIYAGCPDEVVTALSAAVLATLVPHEP